MFRPAARFLTGPRPPDFFAARFLAAVILPPLLFFAINELLDLSSLSPNAIGHRVVATCADEFSLTSSVQKSRVTSHPHSSKQVQNQKDHQDHSDNPHASTPPPSPISVIAAATPKHQHEDNNQQD
jgi:hypothetical protein